MRSSRTPATGIRAAWLAAGLVVSLNAFAEIDLTGMWMARIHEDEPERGTGPSLVEYQGLPINDSARQRALSWDPSLHTLEEYQCRPHPADYGSRHSHMRIWKDVNPETQEVTAWRSRRVWQAVERTIWMDNGRITRPPEYAGHSWQGFSVARWEGDVLAIETTHLKMSYVRRNGVPRSDKAVLREHLARHGNHLTFVTVLSDPVYLTEPLIRTSDYELDVKQGVTPYPCDVVVEITGRPKGFVPHYLPGQNPFKREFAETYRLTEDAVLGGAHTMYPEYLEKARSGPVAAR
jgi:hypothetical protein